MSSKNTLCEKCYFSDKADSDKNCVFYIPDAISDIKTINIVNGYNSIEKYTCRYGVSKDTVDNKMKDMDIGNLEEYAKNRVFPKYMLFIFAEPDEDSLNNICDSINALSIKPQAVSIVFITESLNDLNPQKICEEKLGKSCSWKLHMFFDTSKKDYEVAYAALSTDTRLQKCEFITLANTETLKYFASTDRINRINYIINVEQPDLALLRTKTTDSYFYGMFMTLDNFKGISNNVDKDIAKAIEDNYKNMIGSYD
jgi:hypothetical protein